MTKSVSIKKVSIEPCHDLWIHPTRTEFIESATSFILEYSQECIAKQGSFHIALSGGSTPKAIYELMCQEPLKKIFDWKNMWLYWGDERSVLPSDENSNYHMSMSAGLNKVGIPQNQVFRMVAESNIEENAQDYETILQTHLPSGKFDLIMLGMGDDGHTASLFPHSSALTITDKWVTPNWVEKFKTWRMTLTYPFINTASKIMFLVSGPNKKEPLAAVLEGKRNPTLYPSQLIGEKSHQVVWFSDEPACRLLKGI